MKTDTLERIIKFAELPYAVQQQLHRSGQRTVYLGTDTKTNDTICVKICNYVESRVARIQREIKILQEFDSPYFPKIRKQAYITKEMLRYFLDSFHPRDDKELLTELHAERLQPFFLTVEEYIEHHAWADIQGELRCETSLVPFMIHVFEALRMLWNEKIVHRDIKPPNLLVRLDMIPTVIDLGIAKSFREGTVNLTAFGFRSPCTPAYASPEQLFPERKTDVTYKSDQYSFGVLLHELLTGNLPYGNFMEIGEEEFVRRMDADERILLVDANTGISHDLASLIDRLLAVEPYKRFRNVDTILDELARIRSTL